jgi:hypothetical protein
MLSTSHLIFKNFLDLKDMSILQKQTGLGRLAPVTQTAEFLFSTPMSKLRLQGKKVRE